MALRRITPINNNGTILLRWAYKGQRYSFNPVPGKAFNDPIAIAQAKTIGSQIAVELYQGSFDYSLRRYKPTEVTKPTSTLELLDSWLETIDSYGQVRKMVARYDPGLYETSWLTEQPLSPSTFNRSLGALRKCYYWGLQKGLVSTNPWIDIKRRKATKRPIEVFQPWEIKAILEACEGSPYKPLVAFLFKTGCRFSEAIGLRGADIAPDGLSVTIGSSLPVDTKGNGYQRKRKGTKNETIRVLEGDFRDLGRPEGLVFKSPRGHTVSYQHFRATWVKALSEAKVPYRSIHKTRHTLLSYGLEQGLSMPQVAYLAGHKSLRQVQETYGHMVSRPSLPRVL